MCGGATVTSIDEYAAKTFIEAKLVGDAGADSPEFKRISPSARAYALEVSTGLGLRDPEDVAHEVLLRLAADGPDHGAVPVSYAVTVQAWIKIVAVRIAIDRHRTRKRRPEMPIDDFVGSLAAPLPEAGGLRPELVREMLLACYPRGAQCFEAELARPDASAEQLAETLQTSRDNVYQMRSRFRAFVRVLQQIDEHPETTGAELAATAELRIEESRAVERKVRAWLASREG
jgi:DNA-directed RNA polymerase specialized sigma24 family protein